MNTTISAIKKSIKPAKIGVSGIIILGKYTLVKILMFEIKDCVDFVIDDEKYIQGTNAAYEKMGYGIPSLEIFAIFPNTIENIIIDRKGLIIAQVKPNTVCLYKTLISFITMKKSKSL